MAALHRLTFDRSLRQVRAAQLRGRARRRAIVQVLLGSVFLMGALAYALAPDRHAQGSVAWMAALVVFSTADVAFGLRLLARLARRSPVWWVLGSAAWGLLATALLAVLLRA
jgi:RsiW-degrading membrane proteinase PrsW (M82 family)